VTANARSKVVDWDTLLKIREQCRQNGRTMVWTNGCFDLLHVGHVRGLQAARRLGDVLVVGLNSDESARRLKGLTRPVFPATERAELLAALACVNYVFVFAESTPATVLAKLRPDVHCKGADYAPPQGKPISEAAVVSGYGGRIAYVDFVPGVSTSLVIQRILEGRGA
jgi:rfaE bifunctional protein nucleotidyltransferase chain/domain